MWGKSLQTPFPLFDIFAYFFDKCRCILPCFCKKLNTLFNIIFEWKIQGWEIWAFILSIQKHWWIQNFCFWWNMALFRLRKPPFEKKLRCANCTPQLWLGWLDSNQRMTESKSVALPLGYTPNLFCAYAHDQEHYVSSIPYLSEKVKRFFNSDIRQALSHANLPKTAGFSGCFFAILLNSLAN